MNKFLLLSAIILTAIMSSCDSNSSERSSHSYIAKDTLIAYNVLVDPSNYDYDIFITDTKGQQHQNITNHKSIDWVYSAYEDKLFVISDRDTCTQCYFLYETNIEGTIWNKVSKYVIQDSWVDVRNNGKELIVKPKGSFNTPFEIIDRSGNLIEKVDPQMDYFNDPCFSSNGSQIVFRGYNGASNEMHKAELYIYDLNTKTQKKLTTYPPDGKTFGHFQYYAGPPRWNDVTHKISYSSSNNKQSNIRSIDSTGLNKTKLTHGNINAVWHDISNDGRWIAFDGQLNFKADSATTQIFVTNVEKRSTNKITNGSGYKQGPVFVYAQKK